MQEIMQIYKENYKDIQIFISETIANLGNLETIAKSDFQDLFDFFPSLELAYMANKDTSNQISDNIFRNKKVSKKRENNLGYILDKLDVKDKTISITKPYVSSVTGNNCITVVK